MPGRHATSIGFAAGRFVRGGLDLLASSRLPPPLRRRVRAVVVGSALLALAGGLERAAHELLRRGVR